jgi:hypothetical protein
LQNTLNALDTGDKCKDEGQEEVTQAEEEKKEADEAEVTAKNNMDEAYEADVQLESQKYSFLKESDTCTWIQSDPNYKQAEDHYNQMVSEHEEAVAHAKAKDEELTAAIDEAARLKHECECEVQTEHANTWETANSNNDANQQAWTQAHQMLCVVEHKTYENCDVPACPTVTEVYINEEAKTADCTGDSEASINEPEPEPEPIDVGGFCAGGSAGKGAIEGPQGGPMYMCETPQGGPMDIYNAASTACADGHKVCTGQQMYARGVTYQTAAKADSLTKGCYAYDGASDGTQCFDSCSDAPAQLQGSMHLGGVGAGCAALAPENGNGCFQGGGHITVDDSQTECKAWATGVLCC